MTPRRARHSRVAVVTGAGRRRGIGTAICLELARDGADILFTHWKAYDRSTPWGADERWPEALCRKLRALGGRAVGLDIDLSDPSAPAGILDAANKSLGSPTVLVNNAAHWAGDGWRKLNPQTIDAHYAINFRAAALLSVEFARRLANERGGRIVNIVSGQDVSPMPNELAYAASKGALSAFTRSLALELAPWRITVNAVDPGPTDTGWLTPKARKALLGRSPMGRLGKPADTARLVAFLVSDQAAWITGQIIHSMGGFLDS